MKGPELESAKDGYDALHLLTFYPDSIDVLITDHQMPKMDGLELVRNVRATAFTGRILVYSTMLSETDRTAYQETGVDEIVHKGNPALLLNAIKGLMKTCVS
jgi:two-component system response regulator QseB